MPDGIPHLAFPVRIRTTGAMTVSQGSLAHVQQQAEVVVRTRPGVLEAQPEFGLRNLIGTSSPIGPPVIGAITQFVPDHEYLADEERVEVDEHARTVALRLARADEA